MAKFVPRGMGWLPDLPDPRDYTCWHERILPLLKQLRPATEPELPKQVDLRGDDEGDYLSPASDQGPLNSSSACAVLSLVEYFERRIRGRTFEGSRLFLYKVTRNRLQLRLRVMGDTGATLRSTLKTLVQFGVPPEELWPYVTEDFDNEPGQFVYGLAKPLSNVLYFRLDSSDATGPARWETVKSLLAAGFPVVFGFSVPSSLTSDPQIPFRPRFDSIRGGQVALAVGYDLDRFGRGHDGVLVQLSWGSQWGINGNGWMPAAYIRDQMARDFWTLISPEWLDSPELARPSIIASENLA